MGKGRENKLSAKEPKVITNDHGKIPYGRDAVKKAILDAAEKLLLRKSPNKITVREIAEAARGPVARHAAEALPALAIGEAPPLARYEGGEAVIAHFGAESLDIVRPEAAQAQAGGFDDGGIGQGALQ